jgi:hypothetical protein
MTTRTTILTTNLLVMGTGIYAGGATNQQRPRRVAASDSQGDT